MDGVINNVINLVIQRRISVKSGWRCPVTFYRLKIFLKRFFWFKYPLFRFRRQGMRFGVTLFWKMLLFTNVTSATKRQLRLSHPSQNKTNVQEKGRRIICHNLQTWKRHCRGWTKGKGQRELWWHMRDKKNRVSMYPFGFLGQGLLKTKYGEAVPRNARRW